MGLSHIEGGGVRKEPVAFLTRFCKLQGERKLDYFLAVVYFFNGGTGSRLSVVSLFPHYHKC